MSSTIVSNVSKNVIFSFSCSGSLLNTWSVKWSQNNSIAFIINRGLYIFESRLDPNESTHHFPYHKTIIENPNETMTFDCGIYAAELMCCIGLDEQHLLMLDQTLMTDTANAPQFRCYRSVEWSPLCGQHECLLALLTLDHRLAIYRKHSSQWRKTCDLSLLLNETMKKSWNPIDSPNYSIYRERVYSLATVAFCWANQWLQTSDDSNPSCVLYLGSKNGLITFWKITIKEEVSAQLLYKWETGFDQITCLKCFDDFLIICAYNGLVSIIHSRFCFDDSPNPLSLWSEEDNLGVYHLAVKRQSDDNTLDVMFAKSTFVIICQISVEKRGDSITMILKCCKSVLGLHQMSATGICSIIESKYLLTSMDGRLIEIEVLPDLSLKQCEVTLDSVDTHAMSPYGIDCSSNGLLCALIQNISVYYDHLVVKEPIQIIVFSNISFNHLINALYNEYLNQTSTTGNALIAQCYDYLDCFRAFLNSNHLSCDSFIFNLITNEDFIINCDDLNKLRLIRFITRAVITSGKSKLSQTNHSLLKSRAELCEDIILKLFIQNLKNSLSENSLNSENLSNLTRDQMISLKNMSLWLSQRFNIQILNNELDSQSLTQFCPICQQIIELNDKSCGSCGQSHHFLRCSNSLLLCDFVNYKYEKCVRCVHNIIIKPLIWKQFSICLYCG